MCNKQTFTCFFLGVAVATTCLADNSFVPLFDGKTLNGWNALPYGHWAVNEGVITGTQDATEKRHGILLSAKKYGDFTVRLKYKSLDGNSGFYFRADTVHHKASVKGLQAEINSEGNKIGGLYETLGQQWIVQPTPEDVSRYYKPQEWNEMSVTAKGGEVTITVNGVETARVTNSPGSRRGYLGLQLHGKEKIHVQFKDIEIKELNQTEASSNAENASDTNAPPTPIADLSRCSTARHSTVGKPRATGKSKKGAWCRCILVRERRAGSGTTPT